MLEMGDREREGDACESGRRIDVTNSSIQRFVPRDHSILEISATKGRKPAAMRHAIVMQVQITFLKLYIIIHQIYSLDHITRSSLNIATRAEIPHLQRGRITTETEMICGVARRKHEAFAPRSPRETNVFMVPWCILLDNRFSSDSACMGSLAFAVSTHAKFGHLPNRNTSILLTWVKKQRTCH